MSDDEPPRWNGICVHCLEFDIECKTCRRCFPCCRCDEKSDKDDVIFRAPCKFCKRETSSITGFCQKCLSERMRLAQEEQIRENAGKKLVFRVSDDGRYGEYLWVPCDRDSIPMDVNHGDPPSFVPVNLGEVRLLFD